MKNIRFGCRANLFGLFLYPFAQATSPQKGIPARPALRLTKIATSGRKNSFHLGHILKGSTLVKKRTRGAKRG